MNFEFCHVKQMHDGESSWKQRTTKEHNPGDARPRVRQSLRIVVPKLCEDFSSRSRKVEEECAPFRGRKGHGWDWSFEATAASLSGRALNFPRLNRSTAVMVVWCFLSLFLSARVRRKVAKAHISYIHTVRGRDVKGVEVLPLLEEFEFLLNGLPHRRSLSKFMFWK